MVAPAEPGVYVGRLRHRRFTPVPHEFTYRLFMVLLDVDRLPAQMAVAPFTSYNRWNWAAYDERDHLGDPALPLRTRLVEDAARAGLALPDGPIRMLTHLRYLGYGFNPVSFFYCHDRDGALAAVMAEVHNTYGGRKTYWLPVGASELRGRLRRWDAAKSLYVSPFMETGGTQYTFALSDPADTLVAHMTAGAATAVFDATLTLERRPWSAPALLRALVRHPAMTALVIAAIHWQALKLYLKGVPVVPRRTPDGVGERAAVEGGPG